MSDCRVCDGYPDLRPADRHTCLPDDLDDPTELDDLSHDYEVDRYYETVSRDADAAQDYSERTAR